MTDNRTTDTFHDVFYDCECTVNAGEDTREKLEADIRKKQREWSQSPYSLDTNTDEVLGWLDRQADITERQGREEWRKAASGEIYQANQRASELQAKFDALTAERDELRRQVSELRELNDSLHARIEEAKEALS